jgi:hypothetical protein
MAVGPVDARLTGYPPEVGRVVVAVGGAVVDEHGDTVDVAYVCAIAACMFCSAVSKGFGAVAASADMKPAPIPSVNRGASFEAPGSGRAAKVAAQRLFLLLIRRADARAVERGGLFEHAFEGELAHRLAVLDHERHVVCAHLERGP